MDDEPAIKTLTSTVVYRNRWMSVREDRIQYADGSPGIYSVVDKPDFAVVIPLEHDGFHLVEQFRYPIARRSWEFPQGSFPPGRDGTPAELAAAELSEETGLTAGLLTQLGYVQCANGTLSQGYHVFLAADLTPGVPHREREEQDMRQKWFARADFVRMIRAGEITDDATLAAYLHLTLHESRAD